MILEAVTVLQLSIVLSTPGGTLATARRLMLEGSLSAATAPLSSMVEEGAPGADRAGLLLEVIRQLQADFSASALAGLDPEELGRLAPTDTMTIDGERALFLPRLDQLEGGYDVPFPHLLAAPSLHEADMPGASTGGTLELDLRLGGETVSEGDSVGLWLPLALDEGWQSSGEPSWEVQGLVDGFSTSVRRGAEVHPGLHITGEVSAEGFVEVSVRQPFSSGADWGAVETDELVLPVPGSSDEVDRNLRSTDWSDLSASVRMAAREAAGSEANPGLAADSIAAYLSETVRLCQVPVGPFMLEGLSRATLRHGCGDAAGASALLVAMLRVTGVPARVGCGLSPAGDSTFYHCFAEAMLVSGSWVPVDPVRPGEVAAVTAPPALLPVHVRTVRSLEDSLSPAPRTLPVALPGCLPHVEVLDEGGSWRALPLDELRESFSPGVRAGG